MIIIIFFFLKILSGLNVLKMQAKLNYYLKHAVDGDQISSCNNGSLQKELCA